MNFNMNTPSKFINDKNEVFSFYIPHLSKKYTEQDIKDIFITADIGDVKRADFIEKTSDNKNNLYVSVFVHMNNVFNTKIGNLVVNETYDMNTAYKLQLSGREYWLLLKNHKPIQDTELNIHQLAENNRLLEEKITSQDSILTEQQELIKQQQEQIKRLQETIDYLTWQDKNKIMTIDELNTDDDSIQHDEPTSVVIDLTQYDDTLQHNEPTSVVIDLTQYDDDQYNDPSTVIIDLDDPDTYDIDDDADDDYESVLLNTWQMYFNNEVSNKDFKVLLEETRRRDLLNGIDRFNFYGYDFCENPNGSYSMICNIKERTTPTPIRCMTVEEVNEYNNSITREDLFGASLDMNTRRQFTQHLCNN